MVVIAFLLPSLSLKFPSTLSESYQIEAIRLLGRGSGGGRRRIPRRSVPA